MRIIGIIIAVVTIIFAIYTFDWHTLNQIIVPLLLIMGALIILIGESKSRSARKAKEFLQNASIALAVFLLLKWLVYG